MPRTRPAYPPEFRREAIQLMRSSGRPDQGAVHEPRRLRADAAPLALAGRDRRRTRRRPDLRRARRAPSPAAREPRPARGARGAQKSRGLLRQGQREAVTVFRFIAAEGGQPLRLADVPRARGVALGLPRLGAAPPVAAGALRRRAAGPHRAGPRALSRHLRRSARPRRAALRGRACCPSPRARPRRSARGSARRP